MWLLIFLSFFVKAENKQLRVAVIDGGYINGIEKQLKMCEDTPQVINISTNNSLFFKRHGTNIAGLIQRYAGNTNYCFILIGGIEDSGLITDSINLAIKNKADIINLSADGENFSLTEYNAIKKFISLGGVFFTAAGNKFKDLNKNCNTYPACYKLNIKVISNKDPYANKHDKFIISDKNGEGEIVFDIELMGTSQSTAIETGRYIFKWKN
jgi:hypothetical protein